MGAVRPLACERARAWVSLGLDGELSEVEEALLCAHVGRCAACAAFACDLGVLTLELREARLERPAPGQGWARRRSASLPLRVGASAAAVAFAVGLGSLAGSLYSRGTSAEHAAAAAASQHALALADEAALASTRARRGVAV